MISTKFHEEPTNQYLDSLTIHSYSTAFLPAGGDAKRVWAQGKTTDRYTMRHRCFRCRERFPVAQHGKWYLPAEVIATYFSEGPSLRTTARSAIPTTNRLHMKTYEPEGYEPMRQGMNTQFFQVLEFAGNRAAYRAYTATGELYDEAIVEKNFATGAKKIIQNVPATDERNFESTIKYSKKGR